MKPCWCWGLIACGGQDLGAQGSRFSLKSTVVQEEGLSIADAQVQAIRPGEDRSRFDLWLLAGRAGFLRAEGGALCDKGKRHHNVMRIDASTAGCDWALVDAYVGGLSAGDGYLLKARDGALYQLMLVDGEAIPHERASVTFELREAVPAQRPR